MLPFYFACTLRMWDHNPEPNYDAPQVCKHAVNKMPYTARPGVLRAPLASQQCSEMFAPCCRWAPARQSCTASCGRGGSSAASCWSCQSLGQQW